MHTLKPPGVSGMQGFPPQSASVMQSPWDTIPPPVPPVPLDELEVDVLDDVDDGELVSVVLPPPVEVV